MSITTEFYAPKVPTEIPNMSTSEQNTGRRDLDGNWIYVKSFDEAVTFTANAYNNIAHGVTGIDNIVSATGWFLHGTQPKRSFPVIDKATGTDVLDMVDWDATNMRLFVGSVYATTLAISRVVFTIEYTKA